MNMNTTTLSIYTAATSQRAVNPPPFTALAVPTIDRTLATTWVIENIR